MNTDAKILATAIKQLRFERQMSLSEFAETVNISKAYVHKLELGCDCRTKKPISPSIEVLVGMADGLCIPRKEFLQKCGYIE